MVRGLFTQLQFPYAQFSCASVSGDLLYDPFWEAVCRLERLGFKLLAATADGASPIRRLIKLHGSDKLVYKVVNPHAPDHRYLYFFLRPTTLAQNDKKLLGKQEATAMGEFQHHIVLCHRFSFIITIPYTVQWEGDFLESFG